MCIINILSARNDTYSSVVTLGHLFLLPISSKPCAECINVKWYINVLCWIRLEIGRRSQSYTYSVIYNVVCTWTFIWLWIVKIHITLVLYSCVLSAILNKLVKSFKFRITFIVTWTINFITMLDWFFFLLCWFWKSPKLFAHYIIEKCIHDSELFPVPCNTYTL